MFYAGTLGYFAQYNALGHIAAISQRHSHNLAIGYGSFGYEPNVNYLFGIPRSIETGGAAMNIRIAKFLGTHSNNTEQRKQLNQQVGLLSSALEHAVPEQMFADPNSTTQTDAVSAVKALQKAAQVGQRIYHITNANKATALVNINHHPDTMAEINAALNVGKEVITHTNAITVPGWSGAGYIILDPVTGDGSYKISGGGNGGWFLVGAGLVLLLAAALVPFMAAFPLLFGPLLIAQLAFAATLSLYSGVGLLAGADPTIIFGNLLFIGSPGLALFGVPLVVALIGGMLLKELAFEIAVRTS